MKTVQGVWDYFRTFPEIPADMKYIIDIDREVDLSHLGLGYAKVLKFFVCGVNKSITNDEILGDGSTESSSNVFGITLELSDGEESQILPLPITGTDIHSALKVYYPLIDLTGIKVEDDLYEWFISCSALAKKISGTFTFDTTKQLKVRESYVLYPLGGEGGQAINYVMSNLNGATNIGIGVGIIEGAVQFMGFPSLDEFTHLYSGNTWEVSDCVLEVTDTAYVSPDFADFLSDNATSGVIEEQIFKTVRIPDNIMHMATLQMIQDMKSGKIPLPQPEIPENGVVSYTFTLDSYDGEARYEQEIDKSLAQEIIQQLRNGDKVVQLKLVGTLGNTSFIFAAPLSLYELSTWGAYGAGLVHFGNLGTYLIGVAYALGEGLSGWKIFIIDITTPKFDLDTRYVDDDTRLAVVTRVAPAENSSFLTENVAFPSNTYSANQGKILGIKDNAFVAMDLPEPTMQESVYELVDIESFVTQYMNFSNREEVMDYMAHHGVYLDDYISSPVYAYTKSVSITLSNTDDFIGNIDIYGTESATGLGSFSDSKIALFFTDIDGSYGIIRSSKLFTCADFSFISTANLQSAYSGIFYGNDPALTGAAFAFGLNCSFSEYTTRYANSYSNVPSTFLESIIGDNSNGDADYLSFNVKINIFKTEYSNTFLPMLRFDAIMIVNNGGLKAQNSAPFMNFYVPLGLTNLYNADQMYATKISEIMSTIIGSSDYKMSITCEQCVFL